MKILPIDYPYFSIKGTNSPSLNSEKIAPGMEVQYIITFTPEENVDYKYNLVCITEREKFLVPIVAIGARGKHLIFKDAIYICKYIYLHIFKFIFFFFFFFFFFFLFFNKYNSNFGFSRYG